VFRPRETEGVEFRDRAALRVQETKIGDQFVSKRGDTGSKNDMTPAGQARRTLELDGAASCREIEDSALSQVAPEYERSRRHLERGVEERRMNTVSLGFVLEGSRESNPAKRFLIADPELFDAFEVRSILETILREGVVERLSRDLAR
jgi:hypothetical protein